MSDSNVARGHKANLSNPNTSEESKKHSKEVLDSMGVDPSSEVSDKAVAHAGKATDGTDDSNVDDSETTETNNRVLGGHKANLHNPNTSEEAKAHSKEILEQADDA